MDTKEQTIIMVDMGVSVITIPLSTKITTPITITVIATSWAASHQTRTLSYPLTVPIASSSVDCQIQSTKKT